MKTKKTIDQLKAKKVINSNSIKGGYHRFEDDEEFVKQTDSIKGR